MKTLRRDLWLMLVPVLILAGIGLALRQRQGITFQIGGNLTPLKVDAVRFETLTPREVSEGYDTKLAVDLGYHNEAPTWWGQSQRGISHELGDAQVWHVLVDGNMQPARDKNQRPLLFTRQAPEYNKKSRKYTAHYLLALRHVPAGNEIRVRDWTAVEASAHKPICPPVWIDAVARQRGQATVQPQVSRDPGFKIERHELVVTPPIETKTKIPHWRFRLYIRKSKGSNVIAKDVWATDLELQNAQGQVFPTYAAMGQEHNVLPNHVDESQHAVFRYDFYWNKPLPATGPLWLVGTAVYGDNWPVPVRVLFRHADGRILETIKPRPKPLFEIVSVQVSTVSPAQPEFDGADTVVRVLLKPKHASRLLRNIEWETEYSQHVEDARGNYYWKFPFKDGSFPATADQLHGVLEPGAADEAVKPEIRYFLNLSDIPKSVGRLTFKAQISANGSERVPVSVVVRP